MAPELALEALGQAAQGSTVLDPMCGSGTVLKHAIEEGHSAIGFDTDPLAVLLSRVACSHLNRERLLQSGARLVEEALSLPRVVLPWVDNDVETQDFLSYWFAEDQWEQLSRLAATLAWRTGKTADALRVALSRTIITKDRGASLARDVSHSRPHRVRDKNDFDVYGGFLLAVDRIGSILDRPTSGSVTVVRQDARQIPKSMWRKVDLVITSPPYLNAIDYMRGHRLSLVWLGHRVGDLRKIRANSVGSHRQLLSARESAKQLVPRHKYLSTQQQGMLDRYACDMGILMRQIARVLKPNGEAVIVVGDSTIQGVFVRNSAIVEKAAALAGLRRTERRSRRLPASSRYLPPPAADDGPLSKRMRSEVVFHFQRESKC